MDRTIESLRMKIASTSDGTAVVSEKPPWFAGQAGDSRRPDSRPGDGDIVELGGGSLLTDLEVAR